MSKDDVHIDEIAKRFNILPEDARAIHIEYIKKLDKEEAVGPEVNEMLTELKAWVIGKTKEYQSRVDQGIEKSKKGSLYWFKLKEWASSSDKKSNFRRIDDLLEMYDFKAVLPRIQSKVRDQKKYGDDMHLQLGVHNSTVSKILKNDDLDLRVTTVLIICKNYKIPLFEKK